MRCSRMPRATSTSTVYNPDGTVLQSSASSADNESVDAAALQDGPHTVRVYGYQGALEQLPVDGRDLDTVCG